MRKYTYLVMGIASSVILMAGGALLTDLILQYMYGKLGVHGAVFALPLLCIASGGVFTELCNRAYDAADGFGEKKRLVGRWFRNALFGALLIAFFYAYTVLFLQQNDRMMTESDLRTKIGVAIAAVLCSVVIYARNYHQLRSRKDRVSSLRTRAVRYGKRRFTFNVESSELAKDMSSILVYGRLSGSMHVGDEVHLLFPGLNEKSMFQVTGIREDQMDVKKAKDCKCCITLDTINGSDDVIPRYGVLTDINETGAGEEENLSENPILLSYIKDYNLFCKDSTYMSLLVYAMSHARFVVAARLPQDEKSQGDIMDPLSGTAKVEFLSVTTANDPEAPVLPVFTDWDALAGWTSMMHESNAVTLVLDYPKVIDLMRQGYKGIVINPFGPRPFYLSQGFAESITRLEGYREEFTHVQ